MELPDLDARDAAFLFPSAWAQLCWRGRWWQPSHVDLIEDEVTAALEVGYDLLIETPPRHKKSTFVSRTLPGWFMGRYPDLEVMHASRAVNQGAKWGGRIRNDLEYHGAEVFGVSIAKDTRAKSEFEIADAGTGRKRDGRFFACGVQGGVHGEGFHLLLTDDLVKGTEAIRSDVQLEALEEFCLVDLETRRNSGGIHVGVQTRWGETDPHGIWTSAFPNRYRTLKLRAICEDDPEWPDPMGRAVGEALWPDKYPIERLLEIRDGGPGGSGMPEAHWSALYQQNPSPLEGAIFKRRWWDKCRYGRYADGYELGGERFVEHRLHVFLVVDLAFSEKKSADWTVIGVFAMTDEALPRLLLLDVIRERMQAPDLIPAVQKAIRDWNATLVYAEREGQQIGQIDYMTRAGLPVRTIGRAGDDDVRISGGKEAPWHDASPFIKAGRLWIPKAAPWLAGWERELLIAPAGKYDDQVDVTSWAVHAVGLVSQPMEAGAGYADAVEKIASERNQSYAGFTATGGRRRRPR